ncbi:MAG TPA: DUF3459 domain-containing protein, partial [Thermoanaerobaculia bacterium]|nr:DUF3459 domain-containing protein [Thermoanaerobaculia bacterium]
QGQRYVWQKKRRGTPSRDFAPERFVCYLDNHDQVANSGSGARIHQSTDRGRYKAMTALLLLQPQTPMLFQGQEFGAGAPFVYFAHHTGELAQLVEKGRREFMEQFPSLKGLPIAPPHERATLAMCVLDHTQRDAEIETMHRELLALRREMPPADALEAATLSEECFVLRWFAEDDRLLIVNLGRDLHLEPAPEPLLASLAGWRMVWATGHMPEPERDGVWDIPGHSAVLLKPVTA